MTVDLLKLVLLLAYGPFLVMLLIFGLGLLMKWSGRPDLLEWLVSKTEAQKPLARK